MKQWNVAKLNKMVAMAIAKKYELPMLLSMLLAIRGIISENDISDFLNNETTLRDPFEIKDMDKAVERIQNAVDNFEKICIYGDYDADGVTSTALLYSYLSDIGANVIYYIPSRENEGYGMNNSAIDYLNENEVKLIVTVDNGISAVDEISYANRLGIDTVVTDHHMPQQQLPNAVAVVDPHREDCNSTFKDLSGVGVAFKLVCALEGNGCDSAQLLENYSDIAALGTIGDVVPLVGENRVIVKNGLRHIRNHDRCGISQMLEEAGLLNKPLSAGKVSFTLVPRINAGGRLGLSQKSVELLLSENPQDAMEIAKELGEDNRTRQEIEKEIVDKIIEATNENPQLTYDRVIVVDGDNWHQGVIGIVASRLKEIYDKPVIVITKDGDKAKGSGRSIEGFSLCNAVAYCSDLLNHHGGHPMAVGLGLDSDKIPDFRKKINEYARMQEQMPLSSVLIDCKLNPAQLDISLANQLTYLEPYGCSNTAPLFGLFNMTILAITPIGNGKHLRIAFKREDSTVVAVKFFSVKYDFPYVNGDVVDLAVTLDANNFSGREYLSIVIKEMKLSIADNEQMVLSQRIYEDFCLDIITENTKEIIPTREDFANVYRYLKANNGFNFSIDILVCRVENKVSYGKVQVILKAMCELGLIELKRKDQNIKVTLKECSNKVELENAQIIKRLKEVCNNG